MPAETKRMSEKNRVSKEGFVKTQAGYLLFRFGTSVARCLPVTSLNFVGEELGILSFYLSGRWRKTALRNLNMEFGKEKEKEEILRIRREVFKHIGKNMVEACRLNDFGQSHLKRLARFKGKEHLDNALKGGKGVIGLSCHLGNFPLMVARLAVEDYPLSLVAKDPDNPKMAKAITSARDAFGMESIPDEPRLACVSRCFKSLKENRVLLLQIDQNAPITEAWVDFFGCLVPTFKGPVLFSIRTGAPILPMFISRDSSHLHQITIHPPFDLDVSGQTEQDVTSNTARLTKIIEGAIREHPEQWLWHYRRFKRARDIQTGERIFRKHP